MPLWLACAALASLLALAAGEDGTKLPCGASPPTPCVQFAYYLWYGTPASDGVWKHWNHAILPHWNPTIRARYPHDVQFEPPERLHSQFYPARGPYSVRNGTVLAEQMREMRAAGGTVLILSWWGRPDMPGTSDTQGVNTDDLVPQVLDVAAREGVQVAWHLEPYPGRNASTVHDDVAYLSRRYGAHAAALRLGGRLVFYVYDSYHTEPAEWAEHLCPAGARSLRGTPDDGFFVGLWLHREHGQDLRAACFDGFYTYFASAGFSYGSTPRNWRSMVEFGAQHGLRSALSVGPGYDDERIRPWCVPGAGGREGRRGEDGGEAGVLHARCRGGDSRSGQSPPTSTWRTARAHMRRRPSHDPELTTTHPAPP